MTMRVEGIEKIAGHTAKVTFRAKGNKGFENTLILYIDWQARECFNLEDEYSMNLELTPDANEQADGYYDDPAKGHGRPA